jgi:hypothetical protein
MIFSKCLTVFSVFITLASVVQGQHISNYQLFTGYTTAPSDQKELILFRRYLDGPDTCYLAVSPQTLRTSVVKSSDIRLTRLPWGGIRTRYAATPYISALDRSEFSAGRLQDAGIRKFLSLQKGIDLTIDLCPSHLPLDRVVFLDLIKEIGVAEKPVPVSISVTGIWINEHPKDFEWLDSLDKSGQLSILWINHSYNHRTYKNVPLSSNFLLAPGTDVKSEVLKLEILLLEKGITPSVFFRFPGLVSDKDIYDKILGYGLIPAGSDAWLAKGQWPFNGSIVLIHANGNEPLGIKDFVKLLREKQSALISGQWELFDLRESVAEEEE